MVFWSESADEELAALLSNAGANGFLQPAIEIMKKIDIIIFFLITSPLQIAPAWQGTIFRILPIIYTPYRPGISNHIKS